MNLSPLLSLLLVGAAVVPRSEDTATTDRNIGIGRAVTLVADCIVGVGFDNVGLRKAIIDLKDTAITDSIIINDRVLSKPAFLNDQLSIGDYLMTLPEDRCLMDVIFYTPGDLFSREMKLLQGVIRLLCHVDAKLRVITQWFVRINSRAQATRGAFARLSGHILQLWIHADGSLGSRETLNKLSEGLWPVLKASPPDDPSGYLDVVLWYFHFTPYDPEHTVASFKECALNLRSYVHTDYNMAMVNLFAIDGVFETLQAKRPQCELESLQSRYGSIHSSWVYLSLALALAYSSEPPMRFAGNVPPAMQVYRQHLRKAFETPLLFDNWWNDHDCLVLASVPQTLREVIGQPPGHLSVADSQRKIRESYLHGVSGVDGFDWAPMGSFPRKMWAIRLIVPKRLSQGGHLQVGDYVGVADSTEDLPALFQDFVDDPRPESYPMWLYESLRHMVTFFQAVPKGSL